MEITENKLNIQSSQGRSIDDLLNEFQKPVEQNQENETGEEIPEGQQPENEDQAGAADLIEATNAFSSEVIVNVLDTSVSFAASRVANDPQPENKKYNLQAKDKKLLIKAITQVMPSGKSIMPTWLQLVLILLAAISPIMISAYSDRKQREEFKQIEAEKNDIQRQLNQVAEENRQLNEREEKRAAKRAERRKNTMKLSTDGDRA